MYNFGIFISLWTNKYVRNIVGFYEFGASNCKEITCKFLRKSMNGEKVGQVVLVILMDYYSHTYPRYVIMPSYLCVETVGTLRN